LVYFYLLIKEDRGVINQLFRAYSQRARTKRSRVFLKELRPKEDDKILDLGSEDGSYIASIIPYRNNVYIADISEEKLNKGREKYNFHPILIDESGTLPFPDQYFDIVFCSSVIEHVTVDKSEAMFSQKNFSSVAFQRQQKFASEISRVAKKYYVQTPNKYFLFESHTWLPNVFIFLPRFLQIKLILFTNRWWPKKTQPDWNLLTRKQMKLLFPEAQIIVEKSLGITKSFMAIKR